MSDFKEIFEQHSKRVYNITLNLLQNNEDAEDVTQEVFIEIYYSLSKFNNQSTLSTWIYRIAVNKSLDFIRKKKTSKRFGFLTSLFHDESGELKHDKPHFDHPGVKLENKEKSRFLYQALSEINEKQRTAFVLFNIEGLSQKEIAEIMDTTPKAVESLIQRAKAALKEKLGKLYTNRGI